jgi:hypothetical protein
MRRLLSPRKIIPHRGQEGTQKGKGGVSILEVSKLVRTNLEGGGCEKLVLAVQIGMYMYAWVLRASLGGGG